MDASKEVRETEISSSGRRANAEEALVAPFGFAVTAVLGCDSETNPRWAMINR